MTDLRGAVHTYSYNDVRQLKIDAASSLPTWVVDYTGTVTTRDQIDYTYDYAGNRLTRAVDGASTLDQTYTYDGLHRLQSSTKRAPSKSDTRIPRTGR